MKIHLALIIAVSSMLSVSATPLLEGSEKGIQQWQKKTNTSIAAPSPQSLCLEVNSSEYNYGWIHRRFIKEILPQQSDAGLYGRFRAAAKSSGLLSGYIIVRGGNSSIYYHEKIENLNVSNGQWIPFYIPFEKFTKNGTPLDKGIITDKCVLQLSLSNIGSPSTSFEIDQLKYLSNDEAHGVAAQLERNKMSRQLLASENVTSDPHPRLLLTPRRLTRIREKITTNPDVKYVYNKFIEYAELQLSSYPADVPFGTLSNSVDHAASGQEKHKQRAQIEGMLVRGARPIEMLAAAYMISGDERYGKHAAKALVNAAAALDHNSDALNDGFYYTRTFYVRALAFGYDWLWPLLSPQERIAVKTTLLGFVKSIHDDSWSASWGSRPLKRVWNWNPGLVSAAGVGMLALEGETKLPEKVIIFDLRRHLRDYLTLGIDPDGCGHEGPTYLGYGIGAGPELAECLREQGRGDLFLDTNWKKITPWLVSEMLPDHSRWNNLSDCNYGIAISSAISYTYGRMAELSQGADSVTAQQLPAPISLRAPVDFLAQFSEKPGDRQISYKSHASLLGWIWKDGLSRKLDSTQKASQLAFIIFYEPCMPTTAPDKIMPAGVCFKGRGLAVSRSGFGTNDIHLAVEAGPHVAGHDQSDKGSFTLYGYGADLAIDSGYGNDGDILKSGSSYAHNMVLVNGKGQPMNWHNQSSGHINGYHQSSLLDWIRVDAKDAWNIRLGRDLEATPSPEPLEKATRSFMFVRKSDSNPPYLVVMDDICKDGNPADYTWLWHIPNSRQFKIESNRWLSIPVFDQECNVLTTPAGEKSGSARFQLKATKCGNYRLMGLVRSGQNIIGKGDSFFVSINGEKPVCWHLQCRDVLMWKSFEPDDAPQYHQFNLLAGETLNVTISTREVQSEIEKLSLIPVNETGVIKIIPPEDCIIQRADEAELLSPPLFVERRHLKQSRGSMAVYPVTTDAALCSTSLFESSRNGSHPRLEHTVNAVEPKFLMVMIPFTPDMKMPEVYPCNMEEGVSAIIKWEQAVDQICFSNGKGIKGKDVEGDSSAAFIRKSKSVITDWALLDGSHLNAYGKTLADGSKEKGVRTSRD
jgi:hypothetical protein